MIPAGRMRRVRRNSPYYQLQPLQRTITTWEVGTGWTCAGTRWVRFDVISDSLSSSSVSVEITPIYDCDRIVRTCFEIPDFDFRTRVRTEETTQQTVERASGKTPAAIRLSRYHRPLVI